MDKSSIESGSNARVSRQDAINEICKLWYDGNSDDQFNGTSYPFAYWCCSDATRSGGYGVVEELSGGILSVWSIVKRSIAVALKAINQGVVGHCESLVFNYTDYCQDQWDLNDKEEDAGDMFYPDEDLIDNAVNDLATEVVFLFFSGISSIKIESLDDEFRNCYIAWTNDLKQSESEINDLIQMHEQALDEVEQKLGRSSAPY
jgi:hypothetical protein